MNNMYKILESFNSVTNEDIAAKDAAVMNKQKNYKPFGKSDPDYETGVARDPKKDKMFDEGYGSMVSPAAKKAIDARVAANTAALKAKGKKADESYSPGDENEEDMVSNCCSAPISDVRDGHGRCSDCKEMASAVKLDEDVNESKFVFFSADEGGINVSIDKETAGWAYSSDELCELLNKYNISSADRLAHSSSIDFASEEGFDTDGDAHDMIQDAFVKCGITEDTALMNEADVEENAFNQAAAAAARANKSEFEFGGKTHKTTMKKDTAHKLDDDVQIDEGTEMGSIGGIDIKQFGMGKGKLGLQLTGPDGAVQLSKKDCASLAKRITKWCDSDGARPGEYDEAIEETTTAGSVAVSEEPKKPDMSASVYESAYIDTLNESVNITTNMSSDGADSMTVSATDEDATALAMLLRNAGMAGSSSGYQEVDVDVAEDYSNSPEEQYQTTEYQQNNIAGGLNGPKTQVNPNNRGDNPLAMKGLGNGGSGQINIDETKLWSLYKEMN